MNKTALLATTRCVSIFAVMRPSQCIGYTVLPYKVYRWDFAR